MPNSRNALAHLGTGVVWVGGYVLASLGTVRRETRRAVSYVARQWGRMNRRYTWWQGVNYVVIGALVAGVIIPSMEVLRDYESYRLSATTKQLTGHPDAKLSSQLSYDKATKTYSFNKAAVKAGDAPQDVLKNKVGASNEKGGSLYALDVPADMSRGVTYHDINSQLEFTLVPEFVSREGRIQDGHLVYPMDQGLQGVYTLKNNGLKEDIIVTQATQDTMRFAYHLKLPGSLEARMTADGGVGIYSGDPALFGDVSYGSEADRAQVEQARNNGEKNHLVFGLPAPVIKASSSKGAGEAKAHFELKDTTLTVVAAGLKTIDGVFTVDPSVVVTSTSDFQANSNNEGMIDFGTSGQITRGGLTGGSNGSWTSTNGNSTLSGNPNIAIEHAGSVIYNGYIYEVGGTNRVSGNQSYIRYAPINTNGTIGTWQTTTVPPYVSAQTDVTVVAYSGYMYVLGGYSSTTSSILTSVYYIPINNNGSLGASWQSTTSLPQGRVSGGAFAYNGFVYSVGGNGTTSPGASNQVDVYYAPINANGTLGSWTSTTSLSYARSTLTANVYNGYAYIFGGANTTPAFVADVQYAKVNSDGTLGSWMTTNSFSGARYGHISTIYNGIAYLYGGWQGGSNYPATVQYARVNANGTLGTWRTSANNFATGRAYPVGGAYNGYLYIGTGWDGTNNYADMQYSQVDRAGQPTAFGTLTNDFSTARALSCSVAYNGYLYNIGGSTSDNGSNNVTTVQYTALNSSTGNNGSWSSTTAMPASRGGAGCVAYNGYLYVVGGFTGSSIQTDVVYYTSINSNGTLGASWTSSGNVLPFYETAKPGVFVYGTSGGAYLYVLGSYHAAGNANNAKTFYASLDVATGAVGTWTTSGNDRSNLYAYRGFAQVGKYLYAFGGHNGTNTAYTAVEYTSINNDGTINAWASTTSMNTAIGFTNGTTVNGCIYSVGGENGGGTSLSNVQYACPAANGTISAWYDAPNLTVATTDLGVTSYNGYIYGVGGYTTSVQTATQYAYVNNGGSGSTGSWATTTSPANAHGCTRAVAYNGYMYQVGGKMNSNTIPDTDYAAINADGTLGSWSTTSNPQTLRAFAYTFAYNGYMYAVGGTNSTGSSTYNTTEYAPINSNGTLGTWQTTTNLATGVSAAAGAVYNGYVYIMGGYDGSSVHNDVQYAAINSNGTLGSWSTTTSFTTARSSNFGFTSNGYLYVMGGYNAGSTYYNDVQYATINSNGTVGSWTYTSSFAGPRASASVAVYGGFVYLMAGTANVTSGLSDTQYAAINANGELSSWQGSPALVGGVWNAPSLAYNGYVYVAGGQTTTSSTFDATVQYASLNSIARAARYSKLLDLGNPLSVSSIAYNGALPTSAVTPGVAPVYFRAAGTDGVFGALTASSAITAGATPCLATSQVNVRYLEVTIVLDDARMGIFADSNGTAAYVTDFTVNSITPHPAPNIRLKLGRTLQSGTTLTPIDTCAP